MTRSRPVFHSLSACADCGVCGEEFASPNIEAFELTGELYCDDCADAVFERLADEDDAPTPPATTCIETIGGDPDTALRLSFQIKVF